MTDSSSEDDRCILESAIDPQFNPNSKQTSNIPKPDARIREINVNDRSELDVTPGFQAYVARSLSDNLDKSLRYVEIKSKPLTKKKSRHKGIKLFTTSTGVCTLTEDTEVLQKKPKKKKYSSSSEDEDFSKLSACAVTSDWVMNGGNNVKKRVKSVNNQEDNLELCSVNAIQSVSKSKS